jgi:hypothetical protein
MDLTTEGGRAADPDTSSSGGVDLATTERIRPLAAAGPGSLGFFYFMKLLTKAGYITQPPRLID